MKNILITLLLFFLSIITTAQTDEHVLLNLGLDSVFSDIESNQPGASIFIQRDGQILYSRSIGLANLKSKENFSENTISNIAALTKTFITYGILMLEKQGKLSINDSIKTFFPELKDKAIGKIKIEHLLSHTSGLPEVVTKDKNIFKDIDKPGFEPGSNYKYSEISYKILILIIEKASESDWKDFIEKSILAPTGMINTGFKDALEKRSTASYKRSGKKYKLYKTKKKKAKSLEIENIWSSVGELRKYVYAIKECVFLDCESLKLSTELFMSNNWRSSTPPPHGFAWYIKEEKGKDTLVEYDGSSEGYRAQISMYKQSNIIVIILSNNSVSYSQQVKKRLAALHYIK